MNADTPPSSSCVHRVRGFHEVACSAAVADMTHAEAMTWLQGCIDRCEQHCDEVTSVQCDAYGGLRLTYINR